MLFFLSPDVLYRGMRRIGSPGCPFHRLALDIHLRAFCDERLWPVLPCHTFGILGTYIHRAAGLSRVFFSILWMCSQISAFS